MAGYEPIHMLNYVLFLLKQCIIPPIFLIPLEAAKVAHRSLCVTSFVWDKLSLASKSN